MLEVHNHAGGAYPCRRCLSTPEVHVHDAENKRRQTQTLTHGPRHKKTLTHLVLLFDEANNHLLGNE
jgi:hypothetical protein